MWTGVTTNIDVIERIVGARPGYEGSVLLLLVEIYLAISSSDHKIQVTVPINVDQLWRGCKSNFDAVERILGVRPGYEGSVLLLLVEVYLAISISDHKIQVTIAIKVHQSWRGSRGLRF